MSAAAAGRRCVAAVVVEKQLGWSSTEIEGDERPKD